MAKRLFNIRKVSGPSAFSISTVVQPTPLLDPIDLASLIESVSIVIQAISGPAVDITIQFFDDALATNKIWEATCTNPLVAADWKTLPNPPDMGPIPSQQIFARVFTVGPASTATIRMRLLLAEVGGDSPLTFDEANLGL